MRKRYLFGLLPFLLTATACASTTVPVESQLATGCNTVAAAYRTAAGYKAQGKLSASTIKFFTDNEVVAKSLCDPTHPPTDAAAAATKISAVASQLSLELAGVK